MVIKPTMPVGIGIRTVLDAPKKLPNITIGIKSASRKMFLKIACKAVIGLPLTEMVRSPNAHLPGVMPFQIVSKTPP